MNSKIESKCWQLNISSGHSVRPKEMGAISDHKIDSDMLRDAANALEFSDIAGSLDFSRLLIAEAERLEASEPESRLQIIDEYIKKQPPIVVNGVERPYRQADLARDMDVHPNWITNRKADGWKIAEGRLWSPKQKIGRGNE